MSGVTTLTQAIARAAAVTPSDSADLAEPSQALWIGGAGAVSVDLVDGGSAVVFAGIAAGTLVPIRAKRVRSTGTTATSIVSIT
jgi:hypothetical protein